MTILTLIIAILMAIIISTNLIITTVVKDINELLRVCILVLKNEEKTNDKI